MTTAKCSICGREFDVSYVRRSMGHHYGKGVYNEYFPDGDVCEYCATPIISANYATGAELIGLMGSSWDFD